MVDESLEALKLFPYIFFIKTLRSLGSSVVKSKTTTRGFGGGETMRSSSLKQANQSSIEESALLLRRSSGGGAGGGVSGEVYWLFTWRGESEEDDTGHQCGVERRGDGQ